MDDLFVRQRNCVDHLPIIPLSSYRSIARALPTLLRLTTFVPEALALFGVFVTVHLLSALAFAETPIPRECIGFNPEAGNWDSVGIEAGGSVEQFCPKGYAYMSADFTTGTKRPAANIPMRGRCCPLPRGVLTEQTEFALEHCPDNYVATGARAEHQLPPCVNGWALCEHEWIHIGQYLRCTAIDTSRYQLGAPAQSLSIGFRERFDLSTLRREYTTRSRIPLGIRYGIGRENRYRLTRGGCVGYPWGALLVGKRGKFCEYDFQVLEYRGAPGDPPAGTPVNLIPPCRSIPDPLDPKARCVRE